MKVLILLVGLFLCSSSIAQEVDSILYYKKDYHKKLTNDSTKAKFKVKFMTSSDGSKIEECINLANGKIVSRSSWNGEEQTGIWYVRGVDTAYRHDYNFSVSYDDSICALDPNLRFARGPFLDDSTANYIAPKGTKDDLNLFAQILLTQIPFTGVSNGPLAEVRLAFVITHEAKIENIVVTKKSTTALNKEAVRMLRDAIISSPPMLNGKAVDICSRCIIRFNTH